MERQMSEGGDGWIAKLRSFQTLRSHMKTTKIHIWSEKIVKKISQ